MVPLARNENVNGTLSSTQGIAAPLEKTQDDVNARIHMYEAALRVPVLAG